MAAPPSASAGIKYSGFASRSAESLSLISPKHAVSAPMTAPSVIPITTNVGVASHFVIFSLMRAFAIFIICSFISGLN